MAIKIEKIEKSHNRKKVEEWNNLQMQIVYLYTRIHVLGKSWMNAKKIAAKSQGEKSWQIPMNQLRRDFRLHEQKSFENFAFFILLLFWVFFLISKTKLKQISRIFQLHQQIMAFSYVFDFDV